MNQPLRNVRRVLALWAIMLGPAAGFAAPDDAEPPPAADVQANNGFMMQEANFDQWIFQGNGNAAAGRARINSHLKLKLDELDRVCVLTETQKLKLTLAARGDMKRFFDQVEELRRKFLAVKNDQNGFNQIWQEISPLQQKQAAGLFGETSIFAKTVRKTLTDEQQARYRIVLDERRRFRYRATIEVSLTSLGNTVALRHDQHEALLKLMVEETQPPHLFGQYDNYVVMYEMSKLPAPKLKGLLDERQWKLLQQQFNQARGLEAHLVQSGIIDQPKGGAGGILKSVRTFIGEGGLGAGAERDEAVKERVDTPADATNPTNTTIRKRLAN
ncbi:MAG: hypothetical protein AABP62_23270 [Planctomycetota bacterium]